MGVPLWTSHLVVGAGVGIFDALFGRSKPVDSKTEKLFQMATARVTLEMNVGLVPADQAGVVYRPLQSGVFAGAARELGEILELSARETGAAIRQDRDEFGFEWVIVRDADFEDLVNTIHMVSLTLADKGFKDQLLAAVFRFDAEAGPVYWLYNYKRGAFYPFVPATGEQQRDNEHELRLKAQLGNELPVEEDLSRWFPLWGGPV